MRALMYYRKQPQACRVVKLSTDHEEELVWGSGNHLKKGHLARKCFQAQKNVLPKILISIEKNVISIVATILSN